MPAHMGLSEDFACLKEEVGSEGELIPEKSGLILAHFQKAVTRFWVDLHSHVFTMTPVSTGFALCQILPPKVGLSKP